MVVLPTIKERKAQKYLLSILLVIILLIISLVYFNFFYSPKEIKKIPSVSRKIEINFSIFETEIFKDLQPFIEIPPFEENFGRENPFTPYKITTGK